MNKNEVTIVINADGTAAIRGMGQVGKEGSRVASGLKKSWDGVSTVFKATAKAVGAAADVIVAAAVATFEMVSSTAAAYEEVGKFAGRVGASTKALSSYQYAAEMSGVSVEALSAAWQRQTRSISEAAQGTGTAVNALKELGLSAQELNDLSPDRQFEAIARAMDGVAGEGERARLAMQLWDKEGTALVRMLEDGSAGLGEMTAEAEKFGLVVSSQAAANAFAFNDSMTRLKGSLRGVKNAMAEDVMPYLTALSNSFANFVAEHRKDITGFVKEQIALFIKIFVGLGEAWRRVRKQFASKEAFQVLVENLKRAFMKMGEISLAGAKAEAKTLLVLFKGAFEGLVELGKWAWENIKSWWRGESGPTLGDLVYDQLSKVAEERKGELGAIWTDWAGDVKVKFLELGGIAEDILGEDFISTVNKKTVGLTANLLKAGSGTATQPDPKEDPRVKNELAVQEIMRELRSRPEANGYQTELDRYDQYYAEKIQKLIENKATEAEINEAYRQQERGRDSLEQELRLQMASQTFGNLASIAKAFYDMSGQQSKSAFRAYKALSIAQTIVGTIEAAQEAYKWGMKYGGPAAPAVAAVATAAAIAAGMARVAAIKSQKMGGGAMSAGGGGGGLAGGGYGQPGASVPYGYEKETYGSGWRPGEGQQRYQIVVQGDVYAQDDEAFRGKVLKHVHNDLRDPNSETSDLARRATNAD